MEETTRKTRHKWEDRISEVGLEDVDWIYLAQNWDL